MRRIALSLGLFATLIGLLWIGQGSGYIKWPASSFMIEQTQWVYYGACLAVVGLFMMAFSRAK